MKRKTNTKVDSQFLVKVIKNETGLEEHEYFEKWFAESDENKDEFSNVALLWDMFSQTSTIHPPDPIIQWEKIENFISKINFQETDRNYIPSELRLHSNIPTPLSKCDSRRFPKDNVWLIRIAALLIIGLSVFLVYNNYYVSRTPNDQNLQIEPVSINYNEIKTNKGQRTTLTLQDGSTVTLNSESKIVYPVQLDKKERRIQLFGEAYISVEPDFTRPFIVMSGDISTIVTGTEFNMFNRNNNLKVVVAEGSVKILSPDKKEILVQRGEMVFLKKDGHISNPQIVDLSHVLAWKNNKLSFRGTPLIEVAKQLELFYNVNIKIVDKKAENKKLTGLFDAESIKEVLDNMELALDISIKKDGRNITIY
ncbi:MAG TPA: FecR domain-containing protein [Ignavibacteriaceae bacterium]|nr:FecR domain-containing protein [Ignavibacteriaceae bacterium]